MFRKLTKLKIERINKIMESNKLRTDNRINISLRLDEQLKQFYTELGNETENSLQGILVSALRDYRDFLYLDESNDDVLNRYSLMFKKVFQLFDRAKIPFPRWADLLKGISGLPFSSEMLTDSTHLMRIASDKFVKRVCEIFDCDYSWLIGNSNPTYENIVGSTIYDQSIRHHYSMAASSLIKIYESDEDVKDVELILLDLDQSYRKIIDKEITFNNSSLASMGLYTKVEYSINNVNFSVFHLINSSLNMTYEPCHDDVLRFFVIMGYLSDKKRSMKIKRSACYTIYKTDAKPLSIYDLQKGNTSALYHLNLDVINNELLEKAELEKINNDLEENSDYYLKHVID